MEAIELARYRLSRRHPFAPPDRRYRIAKICLAHGLPPSVRNDDRVTWHVWRFLKNREAAFESDERALFHVRNPNLSVAFQLHHGRQRRLRPVIEAYFLGAADDASLAKKLALPPDVIGWYRKIFFDVAHLLAAPARIMHDLIGITDAEGRGVLDLHRLWKIVGYALKSKGLDELLFGGDDGKARPMEGLAAWSARQAQTTLALKRFIAVNRFDGGDPKQMQSLLKFLAQEPPQQSEAEPEVLQSVGRHINAMLGEIPWTCGTVGKEIYEGTDIGECDKYAAELRDDELMLLASGEKVPDFDELKDLQIPLGPGQEATRKPETVVKK